MYSRHVARANSNCLFADRGESKAWSEVTKISGIEFQEVKS